jgi:hypothetical protein
MDNEPFPLRYGGCQIAVANASTEHFFLFLFNLENLGQLGGQMTRSKIVKTDKVGRMTRPT